MPEDILSIWRLAGAVTHLAGAGAALLAAAWLASRRTRFGKSARAILAALVLTALWALLAAATGGDSGASAVAEVARNLAMLVATYRLFATDGRDATVTQVRPVVGALIFVELLLCPLLVVQSASWDAPTAAALFQTAVALRLLATIGGLMLVHNLYAGASAQARRALRWPAAGFAVIWLADLDLYTVAYLLARWPLELASLHGLWAAAFAGLMALGGARNREELRLQPSRAVAFQSLSLLAVVAYLAGITAVGRGLAGIGGDFAQVLQFAFLIAAGAAALLILPSRRLRGWMRVTLSKHLFRHRYDYREEWLRFTRTVALGDERNRPLPERVVQAIADITESPAGLLLTPDEDGALVLAARWQWPTAEVPGVAMEEAAVLALDRAKPIVELDELRSRGKATEIGEAIPNWLTTEPRAWALVLLVHFDRVVGAVVLARPPHARRLDWEDFDLLRVVGQQLASYLAESAGQEALAEAARFDDFHRRIAFVMHDIKNLASQLALLARNAERHADKPEFRADMLVTLRNSADKLNALLSRLSRYNAATIGQLGSVSLGATARRIAEQFAQRHPVTVVVTWDSDVTADGESLEQVLIHLVQNAVDASAPEIPVLLNVYSDGLNGLIEIVDSGQGMPPDFIRTRLFKPFVSSKPGGFGIGAYEARELVRAMKGRLEVESHEGLGTRFTIRLPLAAASRLIGQDQKVA